jgi:multidrug efflux pump subunit AcrB
MKLGTGAEAYAPLARSIIGGLLVSVVVTIYLVPAAYLWIHRKDKGKNKDEAIAPEVVA